MVGGEDFLAAIVCGAGVQSVHLPEGEIAITEAIDAIQYGRVISVRVAASTFGIPQTTLQSRLLGTTDRWPFGRVSELEVVMLIWD